MVPALRLFRHADGGLATMNGSRVLDPLVIDTALAQADARGRPIKSLPQSGYERVAVGRTTIIVENPADRSVRVIAFREPPLGTSSTRTPRRTRPRPSTNRPRRSG